MSRLLGFLLLLIGVLISLTSAEYESLCARFADGAQFREPGNCAAYVSCTNGTGTVIACPSNQLYDKENKKCVTTLSDTYCSDQCKAKSVTWVANQNNCNEFYYCGGDPSVPGACPSGYNFDETSQMCVFPEDSDCYDVADICGILPKSSDKFSDPENCDKYYQCVKGVYKQLSCGKSLYYDVTSGDCISMYEVPCKAHPLPSNLCVKSSKPISNVFVADQVSCRGYYYCAYKGPNLADLNPAWNQCPEGLFFNATSQSCNDPTLVACAHNRCEGRGNLLVLAEDLYCQHYHRCSNGLSLQKLKCPRDMFFSEQRQACTFDETSYPICDG